MMGHREPMVSGMEYDALTRAKRYYHWNPGVRKWVKRAFNKRIRKMGYAGLASDLNRDDPPTYPALPVCSRLEPGT